MVFKKNRPSKRAIAGIIKILILILATIGDQFSLFTFAVNGLPWKLDIRDFESKSSNIRNCLPNWHVHLYCSVPEPLILNELQMMVPPIQTQNINTETR